jgi:hypothetical protein
MPAPKRSVGQNVKNSTTMFWEVSCPNSLRRFG